MSLTPTLDPELLKGRDLLSGFHMPLEEHAHSRGSVSVCCFALGSVNNERFQIGPKLPASSCVLGIWVMMGV